MDGKTAGREFTGKHMLAVLVLFFGTIISVNLTLAYFANSTWSGLVVKNSYVESQLFNGKQDIARAHAALGWHPSVAYEGGQLRFTLLDAKGAPVVTNGIKVKLMRPAHEGMDQIVVLADAGDGIHTATTHLADGQWVVEVLAEAGLDTPYRHAVRIFVKGEGAQ
ncbi:FixH family protein [Zhengella sp. ZM62]|uniref:FixH family protein n=1 Tax=Zhengella sedimenti TaxID=3390035 RepID=UPI003974CC1F